MGPGAGWPTSPGSAAGLLLLALLAGTALALLALGRRAALLELAALPQRLLAQSVALAGAALVAALLVLLGAGGRLAEPALLLALPCAALHLAGLGLPLLAARLPGGARVALVFTAAWWLPALLLEPRGLPGWLQRVLEPGLALELASSESASRGAILPAALLAGSVFLAGLSTALSATRTG